MKKWSLLSLCFWSVFHLSVSASENIVLYTKGHEVFLTNEAKETPRKILALKEGEIFEEYQLYDSYFQPSLSFDQKKVVAIRIKNFLHDRGRPSTTVPGVPYVDPLEERQTYQMVIYSLEDDHEEIVMEAPKADDLATPIWSRDGKFIYFFFKKGVQSYQLDSKEIKTLKQFGDISSMDCTKNDYYIRLSMDGSKIFALLENFSRRHVPPAQVWQIDTLTKKAELLAQGRGFDKRLPDEATNALFGSKEHPMKAPIYAADGSFYYYFTYREGFFARYWIEGYKVAEKQKFPIKTLEWAFYTE